MLKTYNSRPYNVLACRIDEEGELSKVVDEEGESTGEYQYSERGKGAARTLLTFSVDPEQTPEVGDFIILASKKDVYLCKEALFLEKYNVSGFVIR